MTSPDTAAAANVLAIGQTQICAALELLSAISEHAHHAIQLTNIDAGSDGDRIEALSFAVQLMVRKIGWFSDLAYTHLAPAAGAGVATLAGPEAQDWMVPTSQLQIIRLARKS
jgi:hypothetical protein